MRSASAAESRAGRKAGQRVADWANIRPICALANGALLETDLLPQ
jgi:hypothetical protein